MDARLTLVLRPEALNLGYSFREIAMRLGLSVSPYLAGMLYTLHPGWPLYGGAGFLMLSLALTFAIPADLRQPPLSLATAGIKDPG